MGKGHKSNLVPARVEVLSDKNRDNIFNIFKLWATQYEKFKTGELSEEEANLINEIPIEDLLINHIYFGKSGKSKFRKHLRYSIYREKDTIYFGDPKSTDVNIKQKTINSEELATENEKQIQFKEFLGTLYSQVHAKTLALDTISREEGYEAYNNFLKNATDKQKEALNQKHADLLQQKLKFIKYVPFTEVIVDDNLNLTTKEWTNYTEYLVSDENRSENDIPLKINLRLKLAGYENPQFKGIYLKLKGAPINRKTFDTFGKIQDKNNLNQKKKTDTDTKIPPEDTIPEVKISEEVAKEVAKKIVARNKFKTFKVNIDGVEYTYKAYALTKDEIKMLEGYNIYELTGQKDPQAELKEKLNKKENKKRISTEEEIKTDKNILDFNLPIVKITSTNKSIIKIGEDFKMDTDLLTKSDPKADGYIIFGETNIIDLKESPYLLNPTSNELRQFIIDNNIETLNIEILDPIIKKENTTVDIITNALALEESRD